jgi:hypothetical protein
MRKQHSTADFRHNAMLIHTQSILLEGKEIELSDGMFGSLDHVCMCDGVSQPSTAELALSTKNTHRKYCFHGPGSLNGDATRASSNALIQQRQCTLESVKNEFFLIAANSVL